MAGSVLPKFPALPGSLPTRKGALLGKRSIVASIERGVKFFHQQLYDAQYKRWWPLPWYPPRAYCNWCRRYRTFPKSKLGHINMVRRDFIQSKFHSDKLLYKCESNTETDLCQDRILQRTLGISKVGKDLGKKMRTFILTLNPNCILNQGAVVQRELGAGWWSTRNVICLYSIHNNQQQQAPQASLPLGGRSLQVMGSQHRQLPTPKEGQRTLL